MRFRLIASIPILLAASCSMWGQRPEPGGPHPPPPPAGRGSQMPPGKWWDRPEMVKTLGLTTDQRKKMDDVFQQMRVKLIDLHAALDKEEAAAEPLMQAAQLDDSKILPQIDRIAQARAELEKAEARLVLGLRHVMTAEQWEMLQQSDRRPPPERGRE
jgi:periplasmic protein CpxP/Spy